MKVTNIYMSFVLVHKKNNIDGCSRNPDRSNFVVVFVCLLVCCKLVAGWFLFYSFCFCHSSVVHCLHMKHVGAC